MSTKKIAITVPSVFLERLDRWAKKANRSISRFIVEELEKRLAILSIVFVLGGQMITDMVGS